LSEDLTASALLEMLGSRGLHLTPAPLLTGEGFPAVFSAQNAALAGEVDIDLAQAQRVGPGAPLWMVWPSIEVTGITKAGRGGDEGLLGVERLFEREGRAPRR
jgi:hypothetical protein